MSVVGGIFIEQSVHASTDDLALRFIRRRHASLEDNLRLGRTVIADCVNPSPLTRAAWRSVAERPGVAAVDIEIVCSDALEHQRRVEPREPDIAAHVLPTWQEVVERDYHQWDRDRLVVDTAAPTSPPAFGRSPTTWTATPLTGR